VADGQDLPMVVEETAKDPEVGNLKLLVTTWKCGLRITPHRGPGIREYIKARPLLDINQKKLEDAQSTVRAKVTTRVLEGLRTQVAMTESQLMTISDKVGQRQGRPWLAHQQQNQYLTVQDDEQTTSRAT
jgi:hypothetical protein